MYDSRAPRKRKRRSKLIVLMLGATVDHRSRMIRKSGLKIVPFDDLDEAAHNAVKLAA